MTDDTKIRVIMIFDVIGRPPKHLIESLEKLIEEIDKEKGVKVKMKDIKEPTFMKDQKDFYTTFAEVEVEIDEVLNLAILLFKYMPAHLEIISPEIIAISNNSWNDILNELTRRLHAYDEIARIMQNEKIILLKKIEELGGNIQDLMPRPQVPMQEEKPVKKKAKGKAKKKR
ncbi:hypothetical protein J4422_02865 [Candidatus Pacearchaeota archaeon]|nr:hypothetical protein [Candidatus Pacearchaeota archaeon]